MKWLTICSPSEFSQSAALPALRTAQIQAQRVLRKILYAPILAWFRHQIYILLAQLHRVACFHSAPVGIGFLSPRLASPAATGMPPLHGLDYRVPMKVLYRAFAVFFLSVPLLAMAQGSISFLPANATILFQGDSITDGGRQRTGQDLNHIMGQDYVYLVAAETGFLYPEKNYSFINRGVSGERAVDLAVRWQRDTLALHPDLLSILVGVNDLLGRGERAQTVEQYQIAYEKLLAQTVAVLPYAKIVLGEPFLLPVGRYKQDYPALMVALKERQVVVQNLGAKYHLPVIRYQRAFDAACTKAAADNWSWDGVHPTYAGHELMKREWLRTVAAAWGTP